MISFNKYRKEQLTDTQSKKDYEEERELLELAFQLRNEHSKAIHKTKLQKKRI